MGGQDLSLKVVLQAQDQASGALRGFGSTLQNLAGDAGPLLGGLLAVGAAVVGVGIQATQMAADYQQQMNMVQALTGSNAQQMSYYDTQVKQLAVDAGVAPTKLASGLYNVLSASYSGADAIKILTLATEDSKIGMTDAATTSNALTNVLRTFGTATSQATRVNGEMLETVTLGKSTFAQYASSITKAASTSKQFGQNMETMNAAWSTLTSTGISAGQATTDYDQLLGVMYSSIGTVTKSLQKNGIAFDETKFNAMSFGDKVQYLNQVLQIANDKHVKITGATKQASQALQALASHTSMYNSNLKTLSDSQAMGQKTASAWTTTQGGFNQAMSRAQASVSVLMIDIGQQLLPVLTQLVNAVTPAITNFTNFATALSHNQVAMDFLKGAAVGFVALILMIVVPAFWAWATAAGAAALATLAATWPIILVAAIIAVLIGVILLLAQHWTQVCAAMGDLGRHLAQGWHDDVVVPFQNMGKAIAKGWHDDVVVPFQNLGKALTRGWNDDVVKPFQAIPGVLGSIWHHITQGVNDDLIMPWVRLGLSIVKGWNDDVVKPFQAIPGVFGTIWQRIQQGLHDDIVQPFENLEKLALQWGQNMVQGFINGVKNMFGQVGQTMGNLMSNVGKFIGFHSPAQQGEGQHIVEWGSNMLKGFGSGVNAAIPLLQAQVALAMKTSLQPLSPPALSGSIPYGQPPLSNSYSSSGGNHYGNNSIVINGANQNPDQIARSVMDQLNKQYRRSGLMGNLSAGGRSS